MAAFTLAHALVIAAASFENAQPAQAVITTTPPPGPAIDLLQHCLAVGASSFWVFSPTTFSVVAFTFELTAANNNPPTKRLDFKKRFNERICFMF